MRHRSRREQSPTGSGRGLLSASAAGTVALALVVALSGCAGSPDATPDAGPQRSVSPGPPSPIPSPSPPSPTAPDRTPAAALAEALAPASIRVPAIDLTAPLIDLGITAEGDMEVPADYDEVGWFTGGGRPGGRGPTVIAGHVDSPTGPAVFVRLSELQVGDTVEVTDTAGTVFAYIVTDVADYPKSSFPTQDVFGAVADDVLRLITCGGVFDPGASSYLDNRVVSAERVTA